MNSLLTVSVCIPAYNEERSIVKILESITSQVEIGFSIEKIVVMSDGSSDRTVELARSVSDKRIIVLEDGLRKGKSLRLNDLGAIVNSDIMVQFDADIMIMDTYIVSKLVRPFLHNADVGLVCGVSKPVLPITFSEKVVNEGIELWNDTKRMQKKSNLYLSEGQVRAMRKSFYKQVQFPGMSADEAFVFLDCMKKGFLFESVPDAIIYYQLPSTFGDYVKQMNRFLKSQTIQEQIFDSKFVSQFYTITIWDKMKSLLHHVFKHPIYVGCYLGYLLFPKILVAFNKYNYEGVWTIIESTKFL